MLVVDSDTGNLAGPPGIVSRGFVYVRESGELLDYVRQQVEKEFAEVDLLEDKSSSIRRVKDFVGDMLYAQTKRRPVVMTEIMAV